MEIRLQDRDYLAGPGRGIYGAADINVFPWWVPAFNRNLLVTYDHAGFVVMHLQASNLLMNGRISR
jgi:hypothetical protein